MPMPIPPTIEEGTVIYDTIMGEIEPDLVSGMAEKLDEKYAGESEEDTKIRMERYAKAFVEYEKRYTEYKEQKDAEVRAFSRDTMRATEGNSAKKEETKLADLETQISQAA